jgi:hypothetical protein
MIVLNIVPPFGVVDSTVRRRGGGRIGKAPHAKRGFSAITRRVCVGIGPTRNPVADFPHRMRGGERTRGATRATIIRP